jgi:putative MATE family efflux protein
MALQRRKKQWSFRQGWQHIQQALWTGEQLEVTRMPLKLGIGYLALPMIVEMMMESLFAVVDIFFVGKLGKYALTTVGLTESLLTLIYSAGIGMAMAATALISRRWGEKKYQEAGHAALHLVLTGALISLPLGVLGFLGAPWLLGLMGAEPAVLDVGSTYSQIIFAGNLPILLIFMQNGIFRGAGKPQVAMKALILANTLNLVLDPLFIFGIGSWNGWGLTGAAIATTTGRSIGVLYQWWELSRDRDFFPALQQRMRLSMAMMRHILVLSFGGMAQFLIESASWMALTRIMAIFGSIHLAAFTILMRTLMFTLMPAWGLSAAAATMVGQHLGAGKIKRAIQSVALTTRYTLIFLGLVSGIYFIGGPTITGWFTDEMEVQQLAGDGLRWIAGGYVFFGLGMVMVQALNGAGDTQSPSILNFILMWLIQIPLAWLLAVYFQMGFHGVLLAILACHSAHGLLSWAIFKKGRWKTIQI